MTLDPGALLRALFDAAVGAAQAETCLPPHLPNQPSGRTIVLGAGKAAAAMAQTLEAHWRGPVSGAVVTCDGYAKPCRHIAVLEALHPVPDARSLAAADRLLAVAAQARAGDLVLCLLSGGASAVLAKPADGLTLDDKRALTQALLASGAAIDEINILRKHLSAIKGGRLALAAGQADVVNLVISDVVGDNASLIGSGPTVADASTCADALRIAEKYRLPLPAAALHGLRSGAFETPKQLANVRATHIIATARDALRAAARIAEANGLAVLDLGECAGDTGAVAADQAKLVREILAGRGPVRPPCVIISGGELTVTLGPIPGRGGPNTAFALALAQGLEVSHGAWVLAADTDGVDGRSGAAGALLGPDTLSKASALGLDAAAALQRNDSAGFLEAVGGLLVTGPTFTNVNDFRAVLIPARSG